MLVYFFIFVFLRNHRAIFQSGCAILYSPSNTGLTSRLCLLTSFQWHPYDSLLSVESSFSLMANELHVAILKKNQTGKMKLLVMKMHSFILNIPWRSEKQTKRACSGKKYSE
jgi:hypothetical protein